MNLVIDQGNSVTKIAVFNGSDLIYSGLLDKDWRESAVVEVIKTFAIEAALFSSVASEKEYRDRAEAVKKLVSRFFFFDADTPLPIQVNYTTPKTLGRDRIAGVIGAQTEYPESDLLVIDAGTAVTYDLLLNKGRTFAGGNISVGLRTRFRALHEFTGSLPLVETEGDLPLAGYSTETAIRSGVIRGMIYEIDGYIEAVKKEHPDILVFLTGGDAFLLAAKLKSTIFADKKLVLKGLNRILNYNVEK